MAFIVDLYNKYDIWDREHSKYIFELNEQWYAVKEVDLEWGFPQLPLRINEKGEQNHLLMHIYNSYEDAMQFVRQIKMMNAR